MKTKVLQPVLHRDAYTEAVKRPLMAFFDEVLFDPLFAILEEARVPTNLVRENAKDWEPFPREVRGLGVPRRGMPQVSPADHDALIAHLASLGIDAARGRLSALSLRASQDGYQPSKLESPGGPCPPILASRDGYVVDGHHRWFARWLDRRTTKLPVVVFNEDARPLLAHVATFRRAYRANAADSALREALDDGRVWFADGVFSGKFSPAVARELREIGANFDERGHVFRLSLEKLPPDLKGAAVGSMNRSDVVHDRVQRFLDEAQRNFAGAATGIDVDLAVARIAQDLQTQFVETVKGLDFITVQADVNPGMRAVLTRELTENLDLSVKNFLAHEIPELRRMAEENVFAGGRGDKLAEIIHARYGVTKRKAEFLAFQETSLLTAKYRELQAKEIGSLSYKWSTSHDERVRKDHRELNGRTFFFDDPPVEDKRTGARNNPGCGFRCRCAAMPIITIPDSFRVIDNALTRPPARRICVAQGLTGA